MTTTLGTSNVRGGVSRPPRVNAARVTRGFGSSAQRYNTLASNSGLPQTSSNNPTTVANGALQNNDPARLYPGITHFADAIAALPREYRRHSSLMKEVDAKAWEAEENLQNILKQCLADPVISDPDLIPPARTAPGSVAAEDAGNASEVNSVVGASVDNGSVASVQSADPDPVVRQRRQRFQELRQHLMSIMVTMDEKNHVINNANEEVAKHIRRLDRIWPHIAEEISEETRLGSLRHWAYTDINPVKKPTAPTARKEVATTTTAQHDSEIAHRSEARREALLARKQRNNHHFDSDIDETRSLSRKPNTTGKKRVAEATPEPAGLGISGAGAGKRKKPDKPAVGGVGMERSISSAIGGRAMSRESSQQENTKKRKASTAPTTVARKRVNAITQDSPKLASSPLVGAAGKEAYKKSPALSTVRPAGRGRQNSTQAGESARSRPSSSAAHRNGHSSNLTTSTPELNNVAALTGKSTSEVKATMKETKTDEGDRLLEEKSISGDGPDDHPPLRGALLLERSASKQDGNETDSFDGPPAETIASPRLPPALLPIESRIERPGRGRASKTSTPVAGTFAEAEESENAETASVNGGGSHGAKSKRPSRPRVKDHGLHDSLSPKGLPMKRSHKKSVSLSTFPPPPSTALRMKEENDVPDSNPPSDRDEPDHHVREGDAGGDGPEEDEERYCYCQGVSYGEMVACDKPDCPRQWFHLDCIGLKNVPKSAKWYCDECKAVLARKAKLAGNGTNGNGK